MSAKAWRVGHHRSTLRGGLSRNRSQITSDRTAQNLLVPAINEKACTAGVSWKVDRSAEINVGYEITPPDDAQLHRSERRGIADQQRAVVHAGQSALFLTGKVVMSTSRAVLRQPESYRESHLPSGVERLQRPAALGRAVELAFLRWEKKDLQPTERFWRDSGLHVQCRGQSPRRRHGTLRRHRRQGSTQSLPRSGIPDVGRHRSPLLREGVGGTLAATRRHPWRRSRY
ncbi:MAG: hypothetical protein CBARDMAM_7267 [uncultured Caballeronia sp.]|nr:MAG: hypothetical protein CBARDMAM_7267 [uncultured Caballeronia sp.]